MTETDSLANQSYYGLLADDMDGFMSFYNRRKREDAKKEEEKNNTIKVKIPPSKVVQDTLEEKNAEYQRHVLQLEDKEDHFINLRAKVKRKANIDFHEDVERKKEE